MKVVALVPIKLNNERLPNKNIKSFENGKPLITYILSTLSNVKEIDDIYIYCSNESIKNYIPPNIKFLKRSELLDKSTTSMNEILASFCNEVDADIYVLSHATSPFVSKDSISIGINKVMGNQYDSALTVQKLQEFIWKDGKSFNYNPSNIPRTQDLKPLYSETSGAYIFRKDILIDHKRRVGYNPYLIEVSKIEAIDIDEAEDFEIANSIFNHLIKEDNQQWRKYKF